jgi:hypothetical protein
MSRGRAACVALALLAATGVGGSAAGAARSGWHVMAVRSLGKGIGPSHGGAGHSAGLVLVHGFGSVGRSLDRAFGPGQDQRLLRGARERQCSVVDGPLSRVGKRSGTVCASSRRRTPHDRVGQQERTYILRNRDEKRDRSSQAASRHVREPGPLCLEPPRLEPGGGARRRVRLNVSSGPPLVGPCAYAPSAWARRQPARGMPDHANQPVARAGRTDPSQPPGSPGVCPAPDDAGKAAWAALGSASCTSSSTTSDCVTRWRTRP